MEDGTVQLSNLAEATGIEPRTIRSYIERGLLPGAQNLGRGATYSMNHLDRLRVIQSLRRARPNILLNEIRVLFQHMTSQQISALAGGSLTARVPTIEDASNFTKPSQENCPDPGGATCQSKTPTQFILAERVVIALQKLSGYTSTAATSNVEAWNRISVTEDIELSVRGKFGIDRMTAFRELADLLRHLFQHTDTLTRKGDE